MTTENPAASGQAITDAFRDWVRASIVALGTSALSVGRAAGLGKNTLGDFLGQPGRDITLSTAHGITCALRQMAAERGLELPRMVVRFHG